MEGPADAPKPFSADDYRARAERVVASAAEEGLDGVLVTPGPDMVWLTGYQPTAITERLTVLVLARGKEPALLVPALERPDAEAAEGAKGLALHDWADATDPYAAAADLLHPDGAYGVSDSAWALHLLGLQARLPGSRYRSLTECLPMMRAIKGSDELERLAAAGAAADAAYGEIVTRRFAGRRETEVASDLAALLREFGHEQVDFTVVGSGPNGANPHHEAGDRVIQVGDAVVLDFGGLKFGYGSDTTRTVCVGEPTDEIRQVHEIVRRAQQAGVDAVRPGVSCQDIDRAARAVITDAGYGEAFIHRTGHGIGVTTHEPPYMVEGEERPLMPGMCFSVEPGIYLAGRFGVRIEDIVTVTDDGVRRLNNTDHGLGIVE
ncbi:MAG TPA: aminopeptidase P family protein [Intrasporangium sp.]|nr:aminopeptidase P family protein [Intrasporangium sp.]